MTGGLLDLVHGPVLFVLFDHATPAQFERFAELADRQARR